MIQETKVHICCCQALRTTDATAQRDLRYTSYNHNCVAPLIPEDHHLKRHCHGDFSAILTNAGLKRYD